MRVGGLPDADHRSVNEIFGFVARLAMLSAAHTTDYVVDAGTVAMIGGANVDQLIKLACRVKLLTKVKIDGLTHYKVVDDPDFLHLRTAAELAWQKQQQADCGNRALAGPVRLRDGDSCRYCGVMVMWRGRPGQNGATLDHLNPGEPATVTTLVVACRGCNSGLRDIAGREREQLNPAPTEPFYSEFTANWLTSIGHPTAPTPRPDHQPDTATRKKATRKKPTGQRTDNQPDTAPRDSDPTEHDPDGPRAHTDAEIEAAESTLEVAFPGIREAIGTDNTGSGRDGSGNDPLLPPGSPTAKPSGQRRKRSRRGRDSRPGAQP